MDAENKDYQGIPKKEDINKLIKEIK
jgi:hypothetical protein